VLEEHDIKRLPAPMIDFYPSNAAKSGNGNMPWHVVDHIDGSGYDVTLQKRGISVKGGPRKRLFSEDNELIKYPLVYWDKNCRFGSSIHRPLPYNRNFSPVWGVLLHFKFFTNYREKIAEAAYTIDFVGEASIRFLNPEQLVDLGFMPTIEFDSDDERLEPARNWGTKRLI
jgi:hypothetical protein